MCYTLGPLIEILLARGETSQAASIAAEYGYGATQPHALIVPTLPPCTAGFCFTADTTL